MADCPCTHIPTASGITVTSGNTTYDGGATCTGFTAGDMNDFITHISDLVCSINSLLVSLTVDAEDVTLTGIVAPKCVTTTGFTNLAEWLNSVADYLCVVDNVLTNLTVTDIGGTFDISCLGGSATADLQTTVQTLITALCAIDSGQAVSDLLMDGGSLGLPLLMFAKDAVTVTDISALGVAEINIDATDYWINAQAVSMPSTNIVLYNSQDNYIYVDKDTQLYGVSPVAIGGATPTTNGNFVMWARTGAGVVNSYTVLIGRSPFDSTLLQDDSISAGKLDAGICNSPLENDGSNIVLNYDNDDFDVSAGNLILKAGCIDGTGYINVPNTFEASIELNGGTSKLQVAVEDSVALDAVTGKVQLVNDDIAPGNNMRYGTDGTGTKGWIESENWLVAEVNLDSTDILALHTTPFTLVTCPAGNVIYDTAICVHKVVFRKGLFGFNYTSANPIEIRYTDGAGDKVCADIPATFLTTGNKEIYVANGIDLLLTNNADLVAVVPSADPTVGTKDMIVRVYYSIERVGQTA